MVRSVGGLAILADDLRRVAAARQAAASVVSTHLLADSIDSTYCDAVDGKSSAGGHCRCVSGCIQSDGARPDVNKVLPVLPHHLQEVRLTEMTIAVMQLLCECFDDVNAHAFRAKTRCCDGVDGGEELSGRFAIPMLMRIFVGSVSGCQAGLRVGIGRNRQVEVEVCERRHHPDDRASHKSNRNSKRASREQQKGNADPSAKTT